MRVAVFCLALRSTDHLLMALAGLLHLPALPIRLYLLTLNYCWLASRSDP